MFFSMEKGAVQAIIADKLGVSQGTVSRALHNKPGIGQEVRAKVLEAARRLGYQLPRANGDDLDDGNGDFVGVLVHAPPHLRWRRSGYLEGMSGAAPALDVTLVLHHVARADCHGVLDPQRQPPLMRRGKIKSLILVFRWPHNVVQQLASRYTCISLQHEYPGTSIATISLNHRQAMHEMMAHLKKLGHEKIGFVGRCAELSWSRARFAGYVDSLCQLGMEHLPERVIDLPSTLLEAYDETGEAWNGCVDQVIKAKRAGVTAWMAASDFAAGWICRGLSRRGVRVPEELSITGFDAAGPAPDDCLAITSVSVPFEAMGAAALRMAVNRFCGPLDPPAGLVFDCPFVPGKTTAARR